MKTHLPQVTSLLRCFDHHFEEDPTEASHGLKPSAQLEKTQVESATLRVGGYCLAVPLHLGDPRFERRIFNWNLTIEHMGVVVLQVSQQCG